MNFSDRTVIVTGGTGALGRAVVGALLAAGARCRVPFVVEAEAATFPYKDGVTLVPRDDVARALTASQARVDKEAAARAAFQDGELGLDRYGLRARLADLGIEYVDHREYAAQEGGDG